MDKIYQHIDVREEGKENDFSIGKSLWIGNEVKILILSPLYFMVFKTGALLILFNNSTVSRSRE